MPGLVPGIYTLQTGVRENDVDAVTARPWREDKMFTWGGGDGSQVADSSAA